MKKILLGFIIPFLFTTSVFADSILLDWSLAEDYLDDSGNNHTGVEAGDGFYHSGSAISNLDYAGWSGLDSPSDINLGNTNQVSIEGWWRSDGGSLGSILFDSRDGTDTNTLYADIADSATSLRFTNFGGDCRWTSYATDHNDKTFHYYVFTLDTGGNGEIFRDGVSVETCSGGGTLDTDMGIRINARYTSASSSTDWDGYVSDYKIHDYVLSDATILANYNAGRGGTAEPTQVCSNQWLPSGYTVSNEMYNDTDHYYFTDSSTSSSYDFDYTNKTGPSNTTYLDFNDVDNLSSFSGSLSSSGSSFTFDGFLTSAPDLTITNYNGFNSLEVVGSGTPFTLSVGTGSSRTQLFNGDIIAYNTPISFIYPLTSVNIDWQWSNSTTTISDIIFGTSSPTWALSEVCTSIETGEIETVDGTTYTGSLVDFGQDSDTVYVATVDTTSTDGIILDYDSFDIDGLGGCKVEDTFSFSTNIIEDGVIKPKIGLFDDFTCLLSTGKHFAVPQTYTGFLNIDSDNATFTPDFDFDANNLYLQGYKFGDYILMVILIMTLLSPFYLLRGTHND